MVLITLIIIIIIIYFLRYKKQKTFNYIKTYENELLVDILHKHKINNVILPHNNDYSEKAFKNIYISNKNQIVLFISNNGYIGSKKYLWKTLVEYYGRNKASLIMPPSYIFPYDNDIFYKEYKKTNMYIMKSEQQRQTGLKLTNNYNEIINSHNNKKIKYTIIQKYIKNALTYNNYKLNFRIYLIISCKKNKKYGHVFNDGIITYSRTMIDDNNINFNNAISSFYTSTELYNKNYPITFMQLKNVMTYIDWNIIFKKFISHIIKVLNASSKYICKHKLKYNNNTSQLFGIDFMVDAKSLEPYILEINIGPGMKPYGYYDKNMRISLINNMLANIKIIPKNIDNKLILVWEL